MKLMLRSQANLLLSIKRVTQINPGKRTAGIDGLTFRSTEQREWLWQTMQEYTPWVAKPARRVYIPKANGKQRPLGIPTVRDRVLQAVVKNALEPSWEARFEANSFGFRPGRSVHDAITQCHNRLRKGHDLWVLDADIKGAFDHISHDYVLNAIGEIPGKGLIKQWLKAGYVESNVFHETLSGVPQGGVITPRTMLQTIFTGVRSRRTRFDSEDNIDLVMINFHSLHEGTDNFPLGLPIHLLQTSLDFGRKVF